MNSVPLWVTLIGVAAPLIAIAGSAVAFVIKLFLDRAERRRNQFFELMQFFDSDKAIATKLAAAYELRRFIEHKEFIIRFCNKFPNLTRKPNEVGGSTVEYLQAEILATRDYFEKGTG